MPRLDVLGVGVHILVDGPASDGAMTTALCDCPPGAGAPLHTHDHFESFYVLEGAVAFYVEGGWRAAVTGDSISAPSGMVHGFRNESGEEAKFLTISAPAGHDAFFREADELSRSGRFSPEAAGALCARHGIQLATE